MSGVSGNNVPGKGVTKDDISKEMARTRRNRRTWLQKCNTRMLLISTAVLIALCTSLVARIYGLNGTIDGLRAQMDALSRTAADQQEQLVRLQALLDQREGGDGTDAERAQEADGGKGKADGGEKTGGRETPDGDGKGGEPEDTPEITAAHKVYLTFDDGPSIYTQDILDILEEYDVKATFFVLGKESDSARESMKKIVQAGHTLGMHSYTHKYSEVYDSVESFAEDFAKEQEYIYDVTGVKSTVYRFPGGSSNTVSKLDMKLFAEYLDSQGVTYYDWNISSGDGGSALLSVEALVENCTSAIGRYGTSIILMHDAAGKKTTVEALPEIIETILAMDDTVILPITEDTKPVQHKKWDFGAEEDPEEGDSPDAEGTLR